MTLHIRKSKSRLFALLFVSLFLSVSLLSGFAFAKSSSALTNSGGAPFGIDGYNVGDAIGSRSDLTVTLSTSHSQDLIIVVVGMGAGKETVNVNDTSSLVWTLRATVANPNGDQTEEWYAISPNSLQADSITVGISIAADFSVLAFGVSGANTTSPFDSGVPVTQPGSSSSPSVCCITTSNAKDMILGLVRASHDVTVSPDTGFTTITTQNPSTAPVIYGEYMLVSSKQSSLPVNVSLSASTNWEIIGEAIVQAGSSPTTTTSSSSSSSSTTAPPTTTTTTSTTSTPIAPPITSTTTSSTNHTGFSISTTLAAIIALVVVAAAIVAGLFIRRRY